MVLKKSKHGLNTGNTLRRRAKCMLMRCRRGTMQCRLDADAIDNWIDRVHCSLFDRESIALRSTEFDLMLMLTRFVEWHAMYEMEDSSVEYSLSKVHRWNFSDYLQVYLDKICASLVRSGFYLQLRVKVNFGSWYSHEFISLPRHEQLSAHQKQQTQRKNSANIHVRGIQRKWQCSHAACKNGSFVATKTSERDKDSSDFNENSNEDDGLRPPDFKLTR